MASTEPLIAGVKQYLAELTDDEFAKIVAEVREPADEEHQHDTGLQAGRDRYSKSQGR